MDDLDKAVEEDRLAHGKKSLPPAKKEVETREIKQSTTDPDSGYMVRDTKPKGFFYLDHRTVDSQCNIITDVHVTPGNVHDAVPYLARLDRQKERFDFKVRGVGLDAGYFTSAICYGVEERKLYAVMGYRRPTHRKGYFYKREYVYDAERDEYQCPQGESLIYKTTSREGYRHYQSDPSLCQRCPVRDKCTQNKDAVKTLTRHVWEDRKERVNQRRLTEVGKRIYARRKETVERSFADAKELHSYRYARFRGIKKVQAQCLLTAAAQNMKKIALMLK
jgi:IS5 family transposase